MEKEYLPSLALMVRAYRKEMIARGLEMALFASSETFFTHFAPIDHLPHSGRILAQHGFEDSAPFPAAISTTDMGHLLAHVLIQEARYEEEPLHNHHVRGWEIYRGTMDDRLVAVVYAKWVPH